jgi:hypothetical protein
VVGSNPHVSAKVLMSQVHKIEGVKVSQRMAYRARDAVVEEKSGDYQCSCQELRSLLQNFEEGNPTSRVAYEGDAEQRFKRAFLSHPNAPEMQAADQRILGFDGAFMKTPHHQHQMLILVGRNGNSENTVTAVCLCPSEDADNCKWFFSHCEAAGIEIKGVPLFMDRGKGGIAAGNQLGFQLRFCTRHIIGNLKEVFKTQLTVIMESRIWELQRAESKCRFASLLKAIRTTDVNFEKAIREIPAGKWAAYTADDSTKLYGWNTTNFVESENSKVLPARDQNPTSFFYSFMNLFMTEKYSRWVIGRKWKNAGKVVPPYASNLQSKQDSQARFHTVKFSGPSIAFVRDLRGVPPHSRRVGIDKKTCTCSFTRQFGIPCRHMIAAMNALGKCEQLYDFFDRCYLVDAYVEANNVDGGKNVELPLLEDVEADDSVLAPLSTVKRGRHKRKRIRSRGEKKDGSSVKSRICSKCRMPGHNASTGDI